MKKLIAIPLAFVLVLALAGSAFAGTVTDKAALKTALNNCSLTKSLVKGIEFDHDKDAIEVSFTKRDNGKKFEFEISKKTGKILEKEVEYPYKHSRSKAKVGKKAALEKVAKNAGVKLSVVKKGTCKYRYEDREGTYKVKFKHKGIKYEYKLLAPTWKIIEKQKNWRSLRS